jgi:hypothetical protein
LLGRRAHCVPHQPPPRTREDAVFTYAVHATGRYFSPLTHGAGSPLPLLTSWRSGTGGTASSASGWTLHHMRTWGRPHHMRTWGRPGEHSHRRDPFQRRWFTTLLFSSGIIPVSSPLPTPAVLTEAPQPACRRCDLPPPASRSVSLDSLSPPSPPAVSATRDVTQSVPGKTAPLLLVAR